MIKVKFSGLSRAIERETNLTVSNERHRNDLQLSPQIRVEEPVVEEMIWFLLPLGEILDLVLVANWMAEGRRAEGEREEERKKP